MIGPVLPVKICKEWEERHNSISPNLYEAINNLIAKKWNGERSIVYIFEIANDLYNSCGQNIDKIYWIQIFHIYKAVGWEIIYNIIYCTREDGKCAPTSESHFVFYLRT